MKGPYERLKYDLRRLWECPRCQRRERSDGSVTFVLCPCEAKSGGRLVPMKLIEEAGHRTVPPIVPKVSEELLAPPPPQVVLDETAGPPPPAT